LVCFHSNTTQPVLKKPSGAASVAIGGQTIPLRCCNQTFTNRYPPSNRKSLRLSRDVFGPADRAQLRSRRNKREVPPAKSQSPLSTRRVGFVSLKSRGKRNCPNFSFVSSSSRTCWPPVTAVCAIERYFEISNLKKEKAVNLRIPRGECPPRGRGPPFPRGVHHDRCQKKNPLSII